MNNFKHLIWGCLFMASFFVACSSTEQPEETVKTEVKNKAQNENTWEPELYAESELVQVMRKMEADLKKERTAVLEGEALKPRPAFYADIKTATSTDPDEMNAMYMVMADQFLANYDTTAQAPKGHRVAKFNGLINTCVACHQQYCQGPIPKIKKLLIEENLDN